MTLVVVASSLEGGRTAGERTDQEKCEEGKRASRRKKRRQEGGKSRSSGSSVDRGVTKGRGGREDAAARKGGEQTAPRESQARDRKVDIINGDGGRRRRSRRPTVTCLAC